MELLTQKEKRVFEALYKIGLSKINDISKETLINRTAIYHTIDLLLKKGLVTKTNKENSVYFQTISLDEYKIWKKIQLQNLSDQIDKIEHQIKYTQNNSPSLNSEIKFFEGFDSIKNLYSDSWRNNKNKQIHAITDYKQAYETMGDFFENEYFKDRISHGIHVKSLLPYSLYGKRDLKNSKKLLREMRFLDIFKDLGIEFNVYDDKVSIISFDRKKPTGILIKNRLISDALRNIMEYIWKNQKS
jgi:sugar-specific transcriptional regulator TrmB